jgi:hypothetical protein
MDGLILVINTSIDMKTFKQILSEANEKIPTDPKKVTLDHLGELTPEESAHRDQKMDLYMDNHGLSGVAAGNKVALEILQMRNNRTV